MMEKPLINKTSQKSIRQYLRRKETGEKFVRQYGIGNYVVNFCCRKKKLIIEIDGGIHNEKDVAENDKLRTQNLENSGYKIIRFTNQEILNNPESVINKIKSSLN